MPKATTNARYRFRFPSDRKLLQLVLELKPYAASHGSKAMKWDRICANLIQFELSHDQYQGTKAKHLTSRACRDRYKLLIEDKHRYGKFCCTPEQTEVVTLLNDIRLEIMKYTGTPFVHGHSQGQTTSLDEITTSPSSSYSCINGSSNHSHSINSQEKMEPSAEQLSVNHLVDQKISLDYILNNYTTLTPEATMQAALTQLQELRVMLKELIELKKNRIIHSSLGCPQSSSSSSGDDSGSEKSDSTSGSNGSTSTTASSCGEDQHLAHVADRVNLLYDFCLKYQTQPSQSPQQLRCQQDEEAAAEAAQQEQA